VTEDKTPKPPKKVKAPTFDILKGPEIWHPRPPLQYLVQGWLPLGCLGMICALGSSHKSWMLVDMALAVAAGRPWLQGIETGRPKRVLYLDYENNEDETARRIMGLEASPIENFHLAIMPDLFLTDKNFPAEIQSLTHFYDFIAIDSLSGGSQDLSENDPRFAQSLRWMKRATSLSKTSGIVILHHSRKPSRNREGEEIADDKRNKPRGTGAIYNAVDVSFDVESISDDESHVVHAKKRGPVRVPSFTVRIEGTAPNPTSLHMLTDQEVADAAKRKRLLGILTRYQKILAGKSMSGSDLAKVASKRKQDVLTELRDLVKAGLLGFEKDVYFEVPVTGSQTGSRRRGSGTDPGTDQPAQPYNVVPITRNRSDSTKQGV
jgi:AAA domain